MYYAIVVCVHSCITFVEEKRGTYLDFRQVFEPYGNFMIERYHIAVDSKSN